MDEQNKPNARKKRIVGEGKGIEKKGDGLGIIQEEGGDAMSSNLLRNEIKSTEGYLPENYNRFFLH